ncbi:NAD(P)/FAD-dependent oxidoreductase [Pedobacter cryophilus]|uniref:FAD-dependent oxidoreductase n=1 Tax=Pedobacter cryophilus TaxID=2571271 RepID=A0A4U1BYL1_9SPHI|nr:NAD(P)/FAD-dependent oxidoreductase [Pedobacter cryophilus]TKB97825.1 FAD-dependent oxidoreductase [Pedobacter cryophilus]
MLEKEKKVIIVGAGIAGLTAAKLLKAKGFEILVIEASDGIGGRVRTDEKDGFLLDRGFQVLLSAYPEAKKLLNYKDLNLKPFLPGAKILYEKGMTEIMDPLRRPSSFLKTLFSPAGSLGDKLQMFLLKKQLEKKSVEQIFEENEQTTDSYLLRKGFSDKMINYFFRPFLSGIFLEKNLFTSSRMFNFVFKMFSEGDTVIPAKGMGEIPKQLAKDLMEHEILLNTKVVAVEENKVKTESNQTYEANYIIIATDQDHIPSPYQQTQHLKRTVTNMYFTSNVAPFKDPIIALNANENALVNNIAVMNQVSALYSKSGESLISISILDDVSHLHPDELIQKVKSEMSFWFKGVENWRYLHSYFIPYALPDQKSVETKISDSEYKISKSVYKCGDYLLNGSINAAMLSAKKVVELIARN